MIIPVQPSQFMAMGARITHRAGDQCFQTELHHYRAFFGCSPSVTSLMWGKIKSLNWAPRCQAKHLLWALMLMKLYDSEEVMAGFLGSLLLLLLSSHHALFLTH